MRSSNFDFQVEGKINLPPSAARCHEMQGFRRRRRKENTMWILRTEIEKVSFIVRSGFSLKVIL